MHPQVEYLLKQPQPEQRSKEWYHARQSRITASAVSSLLTRNQEVCGSYVELYGLQDTFDFDLKCCNKFSSKKQFTLDKCRSKFTSSAATIWGQKYEPIAVQLFERKSGETCIDFGLLSHRSINFLAMSPDSITTTGIMVEIKCPFSRKISGIPCLTYFQQVQIQLEVADLDLCDFAEFQFKEYPSISELLRSDSEDGEDSEEKDKGLFIEIQSVPDHFDSRKYIYPNKNIINDLGALNAWACREIEKYIEENELRVVSSNENTIVCIDSKYKKTAIKTIYWKNEVYSVVRIKRDREWFAAIKPILEKEWNDVLYYKNNVFKQEEEVEPLKESVCLF